MEEKKFPEMLYVAREDDGQDGYWQNAEQPHDLASLDEPRRKIGVYQLVGEGELVTDVTLSPMVKCGG